LGVKFVRTLDLVALNRSAILENHPIGSILVTVGHSERKRLVASVTALEVGKGIVGLSLVWNAPRTCYRLFFAHFLQGGWRRCFNLPVAVQSGGNSGL
jgi:hypothetical protein